LFNKQGRHYLDDLVFERILEKANDRAWVLTHPDSVVEVKQGKKPQDFTKTKEWCDREIYNSALQTLCKIVDEETPHQKAIFIKEAVEQAENAIRISTPYMQYADFGEPDRQRVMRYLMLRLCQVF
jgi:hypothetical protein